MIRRRCVLPAPGLNGSQCPCPWRNREAGASRVLVFSARHAVTDEFDALFARKAFTLARFSADMGKAVVPFSLPPERLTRIGLDAVLETELFSLLSLASVNERSRKEYNCKREPGGFHSSAAKHAHSAAS